MAMVKRIENFLAQLCLLILLGIAIGLLLPVVADAEDFQKKQLLVLHSYHKGYKWTDDITLGIERVFIDKRRPVKIHYEYMDTKRISGTAYFKLLRETYRYKFKNMKFDAVIVSDNDALDFMITYRDEIFPNVPIIFCGINDFTPLQLHGAKRVTGVNEAADIKETLELALDFHPDVKKIVVINDTTTTGQIVHREIERIIPILKRPVRFDFIERTTIPEINSYVQGLGNDSLIFFTLFSRDKNGKFLEYDEAVSSIAINSNAPIYGVWDFYLGLGVVGGKLTSGFSQGETAGGLADRILGGEDVENIPVVMKSPNKFMLDFNQLKRFDISLGDLPKDSIVINRPASLYTVSRKVFVTIIAALAGSVLIIFFLLYNTIRRRRAEQRSRRLAAIVDSSDDAIIGKTLDGVITSWNKGAEKIFGFNESEMIGKPVTVLVPPTHKESILLAHDMIRRGEHIEHYETVRMCKDGRLIDMSLTFSPVSDEEGKVVAVSTIGRDITEHKKTEGLQLENALINKELEIAQEIQQSFLLACPEGFPGMIMACTCEPAAHVGGDYYDLFDLKNGLVDVVIADITGHSVGSALLMTETRSVLQAKVSDNHTPANLLNELNNLLMRDLAKVEMQISMFYARIDMDNHRIIYANAGHCRPFFYSAKNGLLSQLDAEGMIMGVVDDVAFEEAFVQFEKDDILFLYTDGIVEAENEQQELFGSDRLSRVLIENRKQHPQQLIKNLLDQLTEFTGTTTRSDDVALFAIKFV